MRGACLGVLALVLACGDDSGGMQAGPSTTGPGSTTGDSGSTAGDSDSTDAAQSSGPQTSSTTDPSGDSESTAGDSDTGTPDCTPAGDPNPAWLPEYVDGIVAGLSGAAELTPGVTLSDRATPANRAATADWLEAQFVSLDLEVERHAYSATGTNIVGRLPATVSGGRTLVVGAHFDSVPGSPGANDNATGVAWVLALARYLSAIECRRHDLLFVGFDEEEIGLLGSDAYAAALLDSGEDVIAVHTIDQMGWDQDGDRAVEIERADPGLFEIYEAASAALPDPIPLQPTGTGFTDHVSFRTYGFDAVGLTEEFVSGDTTPHYHLGTDTYDTVNLDYLVSSCVLGNVAFAMLIDGA